MSELEKLRLDKLNRDIDRLSRALLLLPESEKVETLSQRRLERLLEERNALRDIHPESSR